MGISEPVRRQVIEGAADDSTQGGGIADGDPLSDRQEPRDVGVRERVRDLGELPQLSSPACRYCAPQADLRA
jgi:hypothetical protein